MNEWNSIAAFLLTVLSVLLAAGTVALLIVWHRKTRPEPLPPGEEPCELESFCPFKPQTAALSRPASWLAIRSRNVHDVLNAVRLNNAKSCTWSEALAGDEKLFIAPPVNGWILVIGSGLPDPADDVDACFRFLANLSRKLGQVHYFNANHVLNHHAWVRLEAGRVVRAYAWTGRTVWNQGIKTRAELELGLKCYQYFETPEPIVPGYAQSDLLTANTEKVPLLAMRWSLDPGTVDERILEHANGIAGEPPASF